MSSTAGPFTPQVGVPFVVSSPAATGGGGAVTYTNAVVINLTPYELVVATGMSSTTALIDPLTRNIVPLDPQAGQQLTITAQQIPVVTIPGAAATVYVIFYGSSESVPGVYPSPIISNPQTIAYAPAALTQQGVGPPTFANLAGQPGLYRSVKIFFNTITSPSVVQITKELAGGFVLEEYLIYCTQAASGMRPPPIVIPVEPLGATMGEEIYVTLVSGAVTLAFMLDEEPAELSAPWPWYQGVEVPKGPNFVGQVAGNGAYQTIISAPAYAAWAWYIFEGEFYNEAGAAASGVVLDYGTGVGIALPLVPGNDMNDHFEFGKWRAKSQVTYLGAPSCTMTLRYGLGPA